MHSNTMSYSSLQGMPDANLTDLSTSLPTAGSTKSAVTGSARLPATPIPSSQISPSTHLVDYVGSDLKFHRPLRATSAAIVRASGAHNQSAVHAIEGTSVLPHPLLPTATPGSPGAAPRDSPAHFPQPLPIDRPIETLPQSPHPTATRHNREQGSAGRHCTSASPDTARKPSLQTSSSDSTLPYIAPLKPREPLKQFPQTSTHRALSQRSPITSSPSPSSSTSSPTGSPLLHKRPNTSSLGRKGVSPISPSNTNVRPNSASATITIAPPSAATTSNAMVASRGRPGTASAFSASGRPTSASIHPPRTSSPSPTSRPIGSAGKSRLSVTKSLPVKSSSFSSISDLLSLVPHPRQENSTVPSQGPPLVDGNVPTGDAANVVPQMHISAVSGESVDDGESVAVERFMSASDADQVLKAVSALLTLSNNSAASLSKSGVEPSFLTRLLALLEAYATMPAICSKLFQLFNNLNQQNDSVTSIVASLGGLSIILQAAAVATMTITTDPKAQQGTLSSYSPARTPTHTLNPTSSPTRLGSAAHVHSVSLNALATTSPPRPLGSASSTHSNENEADSDSDVLSKLSFSSQDFQRRYLGKADKLLDGRAGGHHGGMVAHSEDNLIDSLLSNYLDSRFLDYVEKMDKEERTNTVKQLLILFAKVGRLLTVSTYSVELEMKAAMRKLLEETIDIMHAEIAYVYFMDHTRKELILESAALSPNVMPVRDTLVTSNSGISSARNSTKDLLALSVSGSGVASSSMAAVNGAPGARLLPFKYQLGQRFAFGRGVASLCIERDCMINIRNSEADAAVVDSEVDGLGMQPIVGLLAIPLRHSDGRPLGCLVALNKLGGASGGSNTSGNSIGAPTANERGPGTMSAASNMSNINTGNGNGQPPLLASTRLNLPFGMKRHPFSHEDDFLFRILRIQTEMIVSNAASYDDMKKTQKKVEVLLDTTRHLSSQLELSALIQEIMRGARELLGADRCTLFLLDEEKKELWSQIPDKDGCMKHIRFPWTMGIAGAVAMTGQPINIPDAYADPRFNKDVDKTTGYRTSSILCMPIKNADGAIVGVTQMINKLNGVFTADDEQLLDAFSAQAAVAIEKSVLFQQTERMRDYLDSILASLSPCVVSLSQQLHMNTINRPWLMDFLGTTREIMEAQSIDAWLGEDNQMMLQDIRSVLQSGVSAYSSDYELRGASKQTKIINYNIVRHIGGQGVVVIIEDISNERRALSTLSRYMSPELAKLVMQEGSAQLGGVRKQVSVLFSDVRGFTEISESLKPNQVVELLNEHFTHCVNAIIDNSGILDKYIGDAIMAVFGVPFVSADDAAHACNTALRMITDLNEWNLARQKAGLKTISIGVGINTGEVLSGNIGSEKRMEFSCIGDAVNLSSRVEGLTKYYGVNIMITEFTRAETRELFVTRELDTVCPVGKRNPIVMYELVARVNDPIPEAKQLQIDEYEEALRAYYKADFESAMEGFERVLTHGKDKASTIMIERCKKLLEDDALRAAFTGIHIADSK